jgi:hypothetical protein
MTNPLSQDTGDESISFAVLVGNIGSIKIRNADHSWILQLMFVAERTLFKLAQFELNIVAAKDQAVN